MTVLAAETVGWSRLERRRRTDHQVSVDYLRTCLTLLVLLHHSIVAYNPYSLAAVPSMTTEPRWWRAFPVVDPQGWVGFTLIGIFNDTFFMFLMFFVSGLFVWRSLEAKGPTRFVRDRGLRLGLPFVLVALLAPLAYYPAYLMTPGDHTPRAFVSLWLSLPGWAAGPAWFIWVLLAFDCGAALMFRLFPFSGEELGRRLAALGESPARLFASLVALSLVVYFPLATAVGPYDWRTFGPFSMQTSRMPLYWVYFMAGTLVGARRPADGLLAPDGPLARQWLRWAGVALAAYAVLLVVLARSPVLPATSRAWDAIGAVPFVVSCAASSFLFVAMFARFARRRIALVERFSERSYGIYLVHYPIVTWLQYALLGASLPAVVKGVLVFASTVIASWTLVHALRRVPAAARVL